MKRGVLYIVWGTKANVHLEASIASVKHHHPELPIHVHRTEEGSLRSKTQMGSLTPFESTLYLDCDTVVMGNLDYAFEKAETFGLACCICEAPWLRRYGHEFGDRIEYNTGVLFFTDKARFVMSTWSEFAPDTPPSRWDSVDRYWIRRGVDLGLAFDDQFSFSKAVDDLEFNPHVLPMNYNFRGDYFHRSGFLPIKVWHGYTRPPERLFSMVAPVETGDCNVTHFTL